MVSKALSNTGHLILRTIVKSINRIKIILKKPRFKEVLSQLPTQ